MATSGRSVDPATRRWIVLVVVLLAGAACLIVGWGLVMSGAIGRRVTYAQIAYAGEVVPMPHHQLLVTDFGFLDRTHGQVLITDQHDHLIWKYKGTLINPHSAYPVGHG